MSSEQLLTHIIASVVLEYRISLDTASELFGRDKSVIYSNLMENKDFFIKKALMYVLDYETKAPGVIDAKKAKVKAMSFIGKFHMAKTSKEKLELINKLNDTSEIDKIKNKTREEITDEDIIKLIEYRYKYALPKTYIYEAFDVTRKWIEYHESKTDKDFQAKLSLLNDYNNKNNVVPFKPSRRI